MYSQMVLWEFGMNKILGFDAIKGEGHSKKLTFLSWPIASKLSAFPLTEVLASEVTTILKKFLSKEATSEATILKFSRQPGHVYVIPLRTTQNWREGKTCNWLASFTRSVKSVFFSSQLSTSLSSMLSFWSLEHIWLRIIWLENNHNPEW